MSAFECTEYPKFPADCKSALSRHLTKELWDKYHGKKDAFGYTLGMAINSGVKNFDSGIGVYAGSADSYTTFADFYDKIIEDYHKLPKTENHTSCMDPGKLAGVEDLGDEFVVSTRIRVGRNLDGYPLGTMITKEQRAEVEKKASEAVQGFSGDLAGKYYKLSELSDADRKSLIDDHFLFKEGDRFLEACGLNRDWPQGRGIFHNAAKTFLVWVNEEDELRIISMQKGGNIREVFERLSRACAIIEKKAKFSHSAHLGYITTCPTNLGTALRASVHVALPLLAKDQARFQKIADEFQVQIRGIHGEHSESEGGVYDISNKRRLGRSEADLVLDMYNGVKAMISAEKELKAKK